MPLESAQTNQHEHNGDRYIRHISAGSGIIYIVREKDKDYFAATAVAMFMNSTEDTERAVNFVLEELNRGLSK